MTVVTTKFIKVNLPKIIMSKTSLLAVLFTITLAVFLTTTVSAFATVTSIEVDGVEGTGGQNIAVFANDELDVRVIFTATDYAEDVRVKAWLSGSREYAVTTPRFDVLNGNTYTKLLKIQLPYDIDPEEDFDLEIVIESRNDGTGDEETINLLVERESYMVDVLDAFMPTKLTPGSVLPIDVVLKNRGRHLAEDTFVSVKIPALGVEDRAYFGDLSSEDQANPDKEDALERRLVVKIPSTAPTGTYLVEIEAYNSNSITTLTRKLVITGPADETQAISGIQTKTFSPSIGAAYTVTLVNEGSNIRVYELIPEVVSGISVDLDEPVVAVPAGMSKTVKINVDADKAGTYEFAVNVHSSSELVKRVPLTANVVGSSVGGGGSATVLLTVVLAIIFVVLLVVLIVLLTKKPEPEMNSEGETYY